MTKPLVALVSLLLFLVSCTTTRSDENVRLKTARAVGGVTSEQVTISNLHTRMGGGAGGFTLAVSSVSEYWEAETPKGHYYCRSDDWLKRGANCVKQ